MHLEEREKIGFGSDGESYLKNKHAEMHEYIRQIFQLFIAWFTFFSTLNYATMGWVSINLGGEKENVLYIVSFVFIVQNILAILACVSVRINLRSLIDKSERIDGYCRNSLFISMISDDVLASPVPKKLYQQALNLVVCALVTLLAAWGAITYFSLKDSIAGALSG